MTKSAMCVEYRLTARYRNPTPVDDVVRRKVRPRIEDIDLPEARGTGGRSQRRARRGRIDRQGLQVVNASPGAERVQAARDVVLCLVGVDAEHEDGHLGRVRIADA